MSESTLAYRIRAEVFSWTSLAFVMALLEGGVIGVVIKNGFDGQVSDWMLNFAVAVATGAPFYSNLISFIWVKVSHGRDKSLLVSNLAVICCLCAMAMSFTPFTTFGLAMLVGLLIIARICWSGIMTIRSTIWRANYPRHIRGKVTAKLATMASLLMSVAAITAGWVLDWRFEAFQWLFIGFALLSIVGAFRYRHLTVRHQERSLSRENSPEQKVSFRRVFSVLKQNRAFAKYMASMFILGSGNLMFMAPLIVYLNEHTGLTKSHQILITTAIPLALIPVAVGWWARLLDGNHIFHFRAIHSWGFVCAIATYVIAQFSGNEFLFFVGACCYGIAISGGVIGWNLGHNDFVGKASPMDYMAVHVTLTGIRGLFAPLVGIGFYQWLEASNPGDGRYALLLPLSITTTGGILFVWFNRQRVEGSLE